MATLTPDMDNMFINPYNFVSKTSRVERSEPIKGNLSGTISCKLIVKGELALPDHSTGDDRRFDFFNINGAPIVPGSEIRGCVRSVFEALTPSCFSVMNSNVLTKRLSRPENDIKPGILRFDGECWAIYEALKYKPKAWKGGSPTLVRKWPAFRGGKLTSSYFILNKKYADYVCRNNEIQSFAELLDIFRSYAKAGNSHLFSNMLRKLENGEDLAVFYRIHNNELDYISPAQVSRTIFQNTVSSLLGEHAVGKCGKDGKYCPACTLFGTLGAGNPLSSRLRFFDAKAENVTISPTFKNLPELSSPKITSVEFYSKCGTNYTDTNSWTYDSAGVSLNGRKFYYHSEPKEEAVLGERSIAVKPALDGSTFNFQIAFDRINSNQLRQLLWVLTIGDNDADSIFCHKLGVGKPVGYGSVKIIVDHVTTRTFKGGSYTLEQQRYNDFDISENLFDEKQAMREFKLIANREYLKGKNVSYPIADDGTGSKNAKAAHQWFASNRTQGNRRQAAQFRYVLHPLSEDPARLELPAMVADTSATDNYSHGNGGGYRQTPQTAATAGTNIGGLTVGKTYSAKILSETNPDAHGNTYYMLSVNGVTRIDRFALRVNKKNARGKRIGDEIRVLFKSINDNGAPYFWVV